MDAIFLSRIQFGLTIGVHFLFVPISMGLAWFLVLFEAPVKRFRCAEEEKVAILLARLLGLTFTMGVASGLAMIFQFGSNWSVYSEFVANVFGAPLAMEALLAFFVESTFISLYLFGRLRLSLWMHWASLLIVALATAFSSFCILITNSWMQTPAGYVIEDGKAVLSDLSAAIFNPSTWPRFFHTFNAALVCGAFIVAAICAYIILKNKSQQAAQKALKIAVVLGLLTSLLELFPFGHLSAQQVARTQPEKLAAMEGLYRSEEDAPLVIFAIPGTTKNPRLKDVIELPGLLSWMAFGHIDARVQGIDAFPKGTMPPLAIVFTTFHAMVGIGMLNIGVMALGCFLLWRRRLAQSNWFLKMLVWCAPLPIMATELGWMSAEIGRQPWIVYGLLRTSDAATPVIGSTEIAFSILLLMLISLVLCGTYLVFFIGQIKEFARTKNGS